MTYAISVVTESIKKWCVRNKKIHVLPLQGSL